jgi:glutamate--cysteine ligase catalytic subunit
MILLECFWMNNAYFLILIGIISCLLQRNDAGFLRAGRPLPMLESRRYLQKVRTDGVQQFLAHHQRCSNLEMPLFYWGDEIEYGVFKKSDISKKHYDLHLDATAIRGRLSKFEKKFYHDLPIGCEWQPEYGSWMVESVPKNPYGSYISDLINVEKSMQLRRKRLHFALPKGAIAPTLSNFPMLGVDGYYHSKNANGPVAQSKLVSDEVINPHPRFGALTRNIRERKGSTVSIKVSTDTSEIDQIINTETSIDKQARTKEIEMDAMAFGMGCCCLQVTMQCKNEVDSRYLNDQLAILGPIFQALSAATPMYKGELVDTDTRWNVISQAVDDRTPAELGLITEPVQLQTARQPELAGEGIKRLAKSRYSSVSMYIGKAANEEELKRYQQLNDVPIDYDEKTYAIMKDAGSDENLALHIAHLFTRDPLVIFDDAIKLDNSNSMVSHFY